MRPGGILAPPPFGPQPAPDYARWVAVRQETAALLDQLEAEALPLENAPDRIDEAYKAKAMAAGAIGRAGGFIAA